jgi:zinc/manganese transport system permease protein
MDPVIPTTIMLYNFFISPFVENDFMLRALLASIAISISSAPLGVFLVIRRITLASDAISHAILPGVAIAFIVFGFSPFKMALGGVIAGIIIAALASSLTYFTKLKEDSSFTGAYLISLAFGVLLISSSGNDIDLLHLLFGDALSIAENSLFFTLSISSASFLVFCLIYRGLIIQCFDTDFMILKKKESIIFHQIFLFLLILNLTASFQVLGTMMTIGLITLPAISSNFWTKEIYSRIIFAVIFAIISSFFGLIISFNFNIQSGPMIVLAAGFIYISSILFGRYDSLTSHLIPKKHYNILC